MDVEAAYLLGFVLVAVGLLIVVVSLIFMSKRSDPSGGKAEIRGAGVIMIGPIPIIFGTDKKSVKAILLLSLVLTVVAFIITVVYYWWLR